MLNIRLSQHTRLVNPRVASQPQPCPPVAGRGRRSYERAVTPRVAPWLVWLVGCRAPAATPAKTLPTPQELCAHLAALQGATSDEACVEKLDQWRAESAVHYACAAPCMRVATTSEAAQACLTSCPRSDPGSADLDAEATRDLGRIHAASVAAYAHDERFCPSSGPVPATLAAASTKYATKPEDWAAPTWKCLEFTLEGAITHQYEYTWNGLSGPEARYEATARRRLSDGRTRTFRLQGLVTKVGQVVREDLTMADE